MSLKIDPPQTPPATVIADGAGGSPPSPPAAPATPPVGAAPPAATPPAAPDPKTAAPPAAAGAVEPRELGDDEEPDPKTSKGARFVLTAEAFRRRIERGSRQQLKEQFGTDDPAVLKDKLKKLEEYESKAEADRQAQLTKEQQLEEKRAAAEARAEAAEARAQEQEYAQQVSQEVDRVKALMTGVIKEKFAKHVFHDLADHLVAKYGNDPKKVDAIADDEIKAWLAQYAKDNEEYAVAPAAPPVVADPPATPPAAAPPAARPAAGNGVRGATKPVPLASGGSPAQKTPRPGQPNSMTQAEFNEYKRTNGIRY